MFRARQIVLVLLIALLAITLAGCGGTTPRRHLAAPGSCPQAAAGHGYPGACAPRQQLQLLTPHAVAGVKYPDRSNNDPCYCGAAIRAQGYRGLIVKANQGTGFIDPTAIGMVQSARAAGLTVGVYDFDQDYTVAEARVFVARAHAAGIYPATANTFPLYIDVEFGNFSYPGLLAQIAYLRSQGYRVGIYTGQWYWTPHAGCRWPGGVSAWLSGYPSAPVPCGTTGYNAHQFTSTPTDLTVYLGSAAQFRTFVHATPPAPKIVCFGKHAQGNTTCRHVHAEVVAWAKARDSSARAFAARGCPTLAQRDTWFTTALRQHPLTRTTYRRGALAATRRAYRQRGCGTFLGRQEHFGLLVEQITRRYS
jgi:hypothetical protein